jgi:hypothetical protein
MGRDVPGAESAAEKNIIGHLVPSSKMMPTNGRKIICAKPATMNGISK